ncbi:thiosulfate sulfurtransferase/rhodanese-like domain-containing protein 3 isoform X1 [Rhopilema esculentum]|uniref:thiosulfate sulfurtransferase/rhodanese-like domain-containing protein 3 isoform X1 n=1 Tax=Rhopilema esculentum TaxID=499914 RepID=UPI0031D7097A
MIRAAFFILNLILVAHAGSKEEPPIGVTVEQLFELMRSEDVTLIDVREPWELSVMGKIAGSTNIQGWKLKYALSLSSGEFKKRYGISLPAKNDCNLIFHCATGGRSLKAVTLARQMGWYCSRHLLGGFKAWKEYFE